MLIEHENIESEVAKENSKKSHGLKPDHVYSFAQVQGAPRVLQY